MKQKLLAAIITIFTVLIMTGVAFYVYTRNMLSKPVCYTLPGMETVDAKKDLVYKTIDGKSMLMDLYSPPGSDMKTKLPAVILIHGNGPGFMIKNAKNWKCFENYGQLLALSGFRTVAFNHRGATTFANIQEEASDTDDLISHVRGFADQYGIDETRINLFVFSAGGPNISNVLKSKPDYIKSIIGFYTVLDLSVLSPMYTKGLSKDVVALFSPITHLKKNSEKVAPLFLVKAEKDRVKEIKLGMDNFVAEAKARQVAVTYLTHEKGKHGFDMLNDDDRSREIIKAAFEFLKKNNSGEAQSQPDQK